MEVDRLKYQQRFLTKLHKIHTVEIVKKLQDALYRESFCKIVSTRNNLGERFEFNIDPFHELRKS
jgi:hypothetical protein